MVINLSEQHSLLTNWVSEIRDVNIPQLFAMWPDKEYFFGQSKNTKFFQFV